VIIFEPALHTWLGSVFPVTITCTKTAGVH